MFGWVRVAVTVTGDPATPAPVDGVFVSTSETNGCSPFPLSVTTFALPTPTVAVWAPSEVGRKLAAIVQWAPASREVTFGHAVVAEEPGLGRVNAPSPAG